MPQNEPGNLHLYDKGWSEDGPVDEARDAVAVFPGHGDHKVKEFLWRSRGGISNDNTDEREFQLVSWGTDNMLRLQCIEPEILSSVGHVKGAYASKDLKITRKGAAYKSFHTVDETSNRDRRTVGTMSDPRSGTSGSSKRLSALTMGMRASAFQSRHAKPSWRGPSMKAKVSRTKEERSQSQIGWMKGITMTKRKASSDVQKRQSSKDSTLFGHGYLDDGWGEPDTIQEELLRISTQIPKVKWDNIDMDKLTLNASLNGPWGANGETIFIKVKIDIPKSYPKAKAPKFSIEKTLFMPEETHKRIDREVHQLADRFLQRKENCLEVAFTYLLGEVNLESSTSFFKNVRDLDDDLGGLADESSSEDDEDIPAGGSAAMSQELPPPGEADTSLATPTRTIMPPPPRTCSARFSLDGRLVCFFPTKEEKARALFSTANEVYKDRPKGEPFFPGFGRLTHNLGPRHNKYGTDEASATDDDSDGSTTTDTSSSSSSHSESTAFHKMNLWYRSGRQVRKTWSEDRSVRSSGGGTGTGIGTATGTGTSRRKLIRSKSVIVMHDLRTELPSKKCLASEYAIFGDGADVCEHNAGIAEKHGCLELVDVWRYLALLLRTGIPLEVLLGNHTHDSILVIARDVAARADDSAEMCSGGLSGRVKWGQHPLAREFLAELFKHFESIADIQMLAMLSCIFSDSWAEDSVAYAESQLSKPETPLPLKAPSFSLDYYPTDASQWSLYGRTRTNSAATTPATLHTPVHYGGSQGSEEALWPGDPGSNSFSCGETPPSKSRSFIGDHDGLPSGTKSPSVRAGQRGHSLASSITANLQRSFTGASSSSPPTQSKKKSSPAEMILNSFAQGANNVTWGNSTVMGDSTGGRNSLSDDEYRRDDHLPWVPIDVSVVIENQTLFDDDGWLNTPLLEPSRGSTFANYRYVYAEMLQMWGQPLARLEIMKFSVLQKDMGHPLDEVAITDGTSAVPPSHQKLGSSPIALGKRDHLSTLVASGRGLDVRGICLIHETHLEPMRYSSSGARVGGGVGTCDRCRHAQSQLRCVYCLEPVDALYPPCLSCGCASHEECLAEWHASGETLCPAGDECNCVTEASHGQVESWAALQGAMLKGFKPTEMLPSPALGDDDEDDNVVQAIREKAPERGRTESTQSLSTGGLSFGRFRRAGEWGRSVQKKHDRDDL